MDGRASVEHICVGIPCYNRPDGLRNTIRCLQGLRHQNWSAVFADNCSTNPDVRRIAEDACLSDSRFRYLRRPENIGAIANFRSVAMDCSGDFFMWASDDDLLKPDFMSSALRLFREHPAAQMAACTVEVINVAGDVIFPCPGFSRLSSTGDFQLDAVNYVLDPEKQGKANLIYGLYRTQTLKAVIAEVWEQCFSEPFGGDYVFNFAFLCRHPIITTDEIHMQKRQPTAARSRFQWRAAESYRACRPQDFEGYVRRFREVSTTTAMADAVEHALRQRQFRRALYLIPFMNRLFPLNGRPLRRAS